ncbi:MAG TPA: S8 family serine peptidase [Streptosporangiaceae bacterium]|nr:S8 family serine peptidase [Streptosporangiaceae bacterium]
MLTGAAARAGAAARFAVAVVLLAGLSLAIGNGVASAQGIGQQVRTDDLATLRQIDVPGAWSQSRGSGVTVAVLDTGVGRSAPDLAGQVTVGPDYAAGANPPGYVPPHLHGTYIGSIIAGHGSGPVDGEGMIGVAPRAKILSVRVILDDQEPGFFVYNENASYDDAIANGIRYAVGHGAEVINMSLGGTNATRNLRVAVAYAISHNVVVVAAAGNDGKKGHAFTPYSYPASFTGVISVAAVGAGGKRASFSDQNSSVVVSAPGLSVVGAGPGGSYIVGDGTSPASAFVAGIAALIRSRYPHLAPVQVMQAIVTSTRRRPTGGYNPGVGFGEVDAAAALTAAGRLAAASAQPTGLAATDHFGRGPGGPIAVIHRDRGLIIALAAVAAAAAVGFAVFVVLLIAALRRRRKQPQRPASSPPADPPSDPPPPWPDQPPPWPRAPAEPVGP